MSQDDTVQDHMVQTPGGSLYYRTQGHGPPLMLIGGGPSNADTLSALAAGLAGDPDGDRDDRDDLGQGYTVVTYDRRGYSRSHLDDRDAPASISQHADDVHRILADLGAGPATVFGSSIGALIALELVAAEPGAVSRLVIHEPPLGQLLTGADRDAFDAGDAGSGGGNPGAALNALAGSVGVRRGAQAGPGSGAGDKARAGDIELFVQRDIPAVGRYHLDLGRLAPLAGRIVVAGGRDSRDFYPYRCAERLAAELGVPLAELPGHHAGMIQYPAEFAAQLKELSPSVR
ncbi:MAG TPA: alpha/beta hydrolase [Streptosporangiaceae bacterium]